MPGTDRLYNGLRHGALVVTLSILATAAVADLSDAMVIDMDACLLASATDRDVANTTITCFNAARTACGTDALPCETALTQVIGQRADTLLARMPTEMASAPEFAKDRYKEILLDIEQGAAALCADVTAAEQVSCGYRAQAMRLARLRSVASQTDMRLLMP